MNRLSGAIAVLGIMTGGALAAAGISYLSGETTVHSLASVAASSTRIDTVVLGATQNTTVFQVNWSAKLTTSNADSVPNLSVQSIVGGKVHNIMILPGIVDSTMVEPPVQSATWRGVSLLIRTTNDSLQFVVRNVHAAQACSTHLTFRRIREE